MKHQEFARELMKEARQISNDCFYQLITCYITIPGSFGTLSSRPSLPLAPRSPPAQATRQQGKLVETVLHIVDVGGCSLKTHLSATARELFSRIAHVSDLCYPETLGKLIIVNTSKARSGPPGPPRTPPALRRLCRALPHAPPPREKERSSPL